MAKRYGTSIWGQELLHVIEGKSDSGRLNRGRTYANTGRVYAVNIKKDTIKARVEGNYDPFYKVGITFKTFSKPQIQTIKTLLNDNLLSLSALMNGQLDAQFLAQLKAANINLFDDFKMSCNCYDYAGYYACKHIAGLYYISINEIDKNPFLIFALKGFDLVEHYQLTQNIQTLYPLTLTFYNNRVKKKISNQIPQLVALDNSVDFIVSMLADNPPFAPINYKEVMVEFYKKVTKNLLYVTVYLNNKDAEKIQEIIRNTEFKFILTDDFYDNYFQLKNPLLSSELKLFKRNNIWIDEDLKISSKNLCSLFLTLNDPMGTDSYHFLFYLFRLIYMIFESGAFIPAVIDKSSSLSIIYKALNTLPKLATNFETLAKIAPKIIKYQKKYLSPMSTVEHITAHSLSEFVKYSHFMHKRLKNNPPEISLAFFEAKTIKISGFENTSLAKSIYNFFSVFDVVNSRYDYQVYIDKSLKYRLTIYVKDSTKKIRLNQAIKQLNKNEILKFINPLSAYLPESEVLLSADSISLNDDRLRSFILQSASIIAKLGVEIILPKALRKLLKPKLALTLKQTTSHAKSFSNLNSLLDYQWKIAIGEQIISLDEFKKMVDSACELVEFKDDFVVISALEAKNIFAKIEKKQNLTKLELLAGHFGDDLFLSDDCTPIIDEIFKPKDLPIPHELKATLRPYQETGFQWNVNNLLNGFGSILADDMGLGKTVQTICSLLYLIKHQYLTQKVLIVVPTTLINNWTHELDKFAPSLDYATYYGQKRTLKAAQIIITTYDLLRRDLTKIQALKIDCLVIDEAQKIKNPNAKITQSVKSIKAKYRIALSGTPVENKLAELWSIFDFVMPKYLKTLKHFNRYYAKNIELRQDSQTIRKLKKVTKPFMLRRLKTDKAIASDLPSKIITDEYINMTKEQAALYQGVVNTSIKRITQEDKSSALVLKLIIALKQICNHPRNYDKTAKIVAKSSGKSQLLLTLLESILSNNEKVLIFTQYTTMGDILVEILQQEMAITPLFLHGGLSKTARQKLVDDFQNKAQFPVFILSLKAGGVGLNLTAANHVIHYDLWFNPAVENQATDRAFRIGQTKNVAVYRFITKDSFEQKIDAMLKSKQKLSDLSISVGENWLKDMDKDDIKALFEETLNNASA